MENALLNVLGWCNHTKVLDYLLDLDIDITAQEVCEGTGLSRKTVDKILQRLAKDKIVTITRKIGKTQMFKLDYSNPITMKLSDINNIVLEQQQKKVNGNIA